jgi:hypothetical protein
MMAGFTDQISRSCNGKSKSRTLASIILASVALALLQLGPVGPNPGMLLAAEAQSSQVLTPLILSVQDAPIPFRGSDGRTHLVYEVFATNFTSVTAVVKKVEILADGKVLQTLDAGAVAHRLQPAGERTSNGAMLTGTQSLLFVHVIVPSGANIPKGLSHRFTVNVHNQDLVESGANTAVNQEKVAVIGRPLRGRNYISADSC